MVLRLAALACLGLLAAGAHARALPPRSAPVDTVVFHGGAGTLEGKFEDATGQPTFGAWTPVDRTVRRGGFRRSPFMAENLGGHGPGNHAMWAGRDGTADGWPGGAGYGNDWDSILWYESPPVAEPARGQTVALEFFFNLDAHDRFDRFVVEYERADGWRRVMDVDTLDDPAMDSFAPPGQRFTDWQTAPIEYAGGDYADGDRIRLRLRFRSNALNSDEDGGFDGDGPVQVDDVVLTSSHGTFTEDFESDGPWLFASRRQWFGDFTDVHVGLADLDPCRSNPSAAVAFVDRGQSVRNPMPDGTASTGGSFGSTWTYGPDGAVVNFSGGLSGEDVLWNEIWSPEIGLTLPAELAGDPRWIGHRLEFDAWMHQFEGRGATLSLAVRARTDDGGWSRWTRVSAYGSVPQWTRGALPFDALLPGFDPLAPPNVQFALGARASEPRFAEADAAPAPYVDNVRVLRTRVAGPSIGGGARLRGGWPASGGLASATTAERDALDVALDGDGLGFVVTMPATLPKVDDVRLVWILRRNPWFEDAIRTLPAGPRDQNVTVDGDLWSGEVVARFDPEAAATGLWIADLPDVDFFYPGDVLQWHVRAVDADGGVSVWPRSLAGFGEFRGPLRSDSDYDPAFTARALPTSTDASGPPPLLVVHQTGADDVNPLIDALHLAGYELGVDVDLRADTADDWRATSSLATDAGAPSLDQLAAHDTIVFSAAWQSANAAADQDADLLDAWRALPGDRRIVWFADARVVDSALVADVFPAPERPGPPSLGETFDFGTVRVEAVDGVGPAFGVRTFCPERRDAARLDAVTSTAPHRFVDGGAVAPGLAASLLADRIGSDGARDVDLLFPFALDRIVGADGSEDLATVAAVLRDALERVGAAPGSLPTAVVPHARGTSLVVAPNPFNPRTSVRLGLATATDVRVVVHDLRGTLVRTLHDGPLAAGVHVLTWDGRDDREHAVGSGVYFVRAIGVGTQTMTRKIALVR